MAELEPLTVEMPPPPSPETLKKAAEGSGVAFDPVAAARRQAEFEAFSEELRLREVLAQTPPGGFAWGGALLSFPLSTFQRMDFSAFMPPPDVGENVVPEAISEATRNAMIGAGLALVLAYIGYRIYGTLGALAGALIVVGPSIPAALQAMGRVKELANA